MLSIIHLSGPLSGKTDKLPETTQPIVFGRDVGCTIVYPPEEVLVGRKHFALVWKANHWSFEVFPGHFVSQNGITIEQTELLKSGSTVRLGTQNGPSFRCDLTTELNANDLPDTGFQQPIAPIRPLAMKALMLASVAIVAAVCVAIGIGYIQRAEQKTLGQLIANLDISQKQFARRAIGEAITQELAKKVFLIALKDKEGRLKPEGTAWPVAQNYLATNAHVAEIRERLSPGEVMIAKEPVKWTPFVGPGTAGIKV